MNWFKRLFFNKSDEEEKNLQSVFYYFSDTKNFKCICNVALCTEQDAVLVRSRAFSDVYLFRCNYCGLIYWFAKDTILLKAKKYLNKNNHED